MWFNIFFYEKNQFESSSVGVCSLLTLSWNSDIEKNTSDSKIIFCVSIIVSDFGCVYTIYCLIVYLFVEMSTVTKNNSSYFFTLEKDNSYDFSAFSLTNNYWYFCVVIFDWLLCCCLNIHLIYWLISGIKISKD